MLFEFAVLIGNRPHQWIPKNRSRELEADLVLPKVAGSLGWIPLEFEHSDPPNSFNGRRMDSIAKPLASLHARHIAPRRRVCTAVEPKDKGPAQSRLPTQPNVLRVPLDRELKTASRPRIPVSQSAISPNGRQPDVPCVSTINIVLRATSDRATRVRKCGQRLHKRSAPTALSDTFHNPVDPHSTCIVRRRAITSRQTREAGVPTSAAVPNPISTRLIGRVIGHPTPVAAILVACWATIGDWATATPQHGSRGRSKSRERTSIHTSTQWLDMRE